MAGPIIRPNAVNMKMTINDAPFAQPVVAMIGAPPELNIMVAGGLTKAEALAGQIAGSLLMLVAETPDVSDATPHGIAVASLNIAEAILAESRHRRSETHQEKLVPDGA